MTSGVEGRVVDRFGRVVFFTDLTIAEIDEGIGFVVGNEVGPTKESGLVRAAGRSKAICRARRCEVESGVPP